MCGIAGFVDRSISKAQAEEQLLSMLSTLVHRGPDGEGKLIEAGVAMGMRRLSIIDLNGGWQPIHNEDEQVSVVFNGEIYNYKELTQELKALGHTFKTHSDTEVLVHGYEQWGSAMLEKLRGMFAFAILDKRHNKLFLARDPFGQKPLYWTADGKGRLAFASETKALLTLPWVSQKLSQDSFLDYVSWFSVPAPKTHFENIFSFPPASYVMLDLNQDIPVLCPRAYWQFATQGVECFKTEKEALEALHSAMDKSVRMHLEADVPIGILLSGGLDSRMIAAYARLHHADDLHAFTASFADNGTEDEAMEANRTAYQFGIKSHLVHLVSRDLLQDIEKVAYYLDQPVGDPAAFAVRRVCQESKEHVKVLLGGEGADELFGGYEGRYSGIRQTLKRTEQMRFLMGLFPKSKNWPRTRFEKLRDRASLSPEAEIIHMRREGAVLDGVLSQAQLQRVMRRRGELAQSMLVPQRDTLASAQALDIAWQLPKSLLRKADAMSMAASIELRCPFLNRDLASFAIRLPENMRLPEGGPGKWILRNWMGRLFPEEGVRPKKGFPLPLAMWMRGELKDAVHDSLFASNARVCDTLDRGALLGAWDSFVAGNDALATAFYALWVYEVWAKNLK